MKMTSMRIAGMGAVCLIAVSGAFGSLLTNGDFEAGNTGFTTEYGYQTSQSEMAEGDYGITDNLRDLHWATLEDHMDHTSGSGMMMMVNGKTVPNSLVWSQTVNVPVNTILNFSMWGSNWDRTNNNYPLATLAVFINGAQIGSNYTTPSTAGVWSSFTAEWDSGSAVEANVEVRLSSTSSLGNDFVLDDLALIPEPASLSLIGLFTGGIYFTRRFFTA